MENLAQVQRLDSAVDLGIKRDGKNYYYKAGVHSQEIAIRSLRWHNSTVRIWCLTNYEFQLDRRV